QEEIPEAALARPGLELLHDRGDLPARRPGVELIDERLLGGVHVTAHEVRQLLQVLPFPLRVFEVHAPTSLRDARGPPARAHATESPPDGFRKLRRGPGGAPSARVALTPGNLLLPSFCRTIGRCSWGSVGSNHVIFEAARACRI